MIKEDAKDSKQNWPGKPTIEFDFSYNGPGIAKGGTAVLKVDGRDFATEKLEHTADDLRKVNEAIAGARD